MAKGFTFSSSIKNATEPMAEATEIRKVRRLMLCSKHHLRDQVGIFWALMVHWTGKKTVRGQKQMDPIMPIRALKKGSKQACMYTQCISHTV